MLSGVSQLQEPKDVIRDIIIACTQWAIWPHRNAIIPETTATNPLAEPNPYKTKQLMNAFIVYHLL